jgi:hypothetical protein
MSHATTHPARRWAIGAGLLGLLAIGILAAGLGAPSRGALLGQLERPAVIAPAVYASVRVGPGPVSLSMSAGGYRARVRLAPNRATRADGVSIRLTRGGAAVSGAAVTASYSMPSMNMWNVLTTKLGESAGGRYGAIDPELAMAGQWQVRFTVSPAGAAPFAVTINDRMRG